MMFDSESAAMSECMRLNARTARAGWRVYVVAGSVTTRWVVARTRQEAQATACDRLGVTVKIVRARRGGGA